MTSLQGYYQHCNKIIHDFHFLNLPQPAMWPIQRHCIQSLCS